MWFFELNQKKSTTMMLVILNPPLFVYFIEPYATIQYLYHNIVMYLRCILKPGPFRLAMSLAISLTKKSGCNSKVRSAAHRAQCHCSHKPHHDVRSSYNTVFFMIKHGESLVKMFTRRYASPSELWCNPERSLQSTLSQAHIKRNIL